MARALRILVTGFGAFPGAPVNPTQAIVRSLARLSTQRLGRLGIRLDTAVLPVEVNGADKRLADLRALYQPDVVLHLGLAARRPKLCVETRALNRLTILHPDAAGHVSPALQIVAGDMAVRKARAPASRLVASMKRADAPTRASIDAGDYICNQTLYLSLMSEVAIAAFIHVPKPRGRRRIDRARRALRPTPGAMHRAVEAAILVLATEARGRLGGA